MSDEFKAHKDGSNVPVPSDTPYPMQPIGEWIVFNKMEGNITKGGLHLPPGVTQVQVITGKVRALGTGTVSITGNRIPLDVKIGDTIMAPAGSCMAIDLGMRRHLIERGLTDEELSDTFLVLQGNVVCTLV